MKNCRENKKERIRIFTFHHVPNYGATLQAYALSTFLKSFNYQANIIDYQGIGNNDCFSIENNKARYNQYSGVKKIINPIRYKFFVEKQYACQYNKFKKFRNDYFELIDYNKNICDELDFAFYGSDQIWNPKITRGFDEILFAGNSTSKNIAYAASIGNVDNFEKHDINTFFELLKNFSSISVRENELKEYIEMNSELKSTLVVDPVFLLCQKQYLELIEKERNNIRIKLPKKYLLVYQLQKYSKVREVAKEKNLVIIELAGSNSEWYSGKKTYNDCGPLEFLYMMSKADYVIANSFHGTAFSILFKKNFNVIESRAGSNRILNLLQVSNLPSRLVKEEQNVFDSDDVNYNSKLQSLNKLKDESTIFTRVALNENE